jgi:hypothetical protein
VIERKIEGVRRRGKRLKRILGDVKKRENTGI